MSGTSKEYNQSAASAITGTAALSGVISGDTVTLNTSGASAAFNNANVGNGKTVTFSGYALNNTGDWGNYTLSQPATSTANITAKDVTLSGLTADNKEYNRSVAATLSGSGSLVGVLGGDTVNLGGTYTASFADWNVGTNKAVTVSGYTIDNTNYNLIQPAGLVANITAKELTASLIGAITKIYNGNTDATLTSANYSLSGVISGDTVDINKPTSGAYNNKNVGSSKNVTVTGLGLSGGDMGNYTLAASTISGAIGEVTAKDLAITANDKTKTYGDANPTFDLAFSGLASGDTDAVFTGYTIGSAGVNAGTHAITLAGGSASNYNITRQNGTLSITQAPLSITANSDTRLVGRDNPVFTASYGGFVNGENAGVLLTPLSLTTNATQASAGGAYAITPSGATALNYTITFHDGVLEVITMPDTVNQVSQATPPTGFSHAISTPPVLVSRDNFIFLTQQAPSIFIASPPQQTQIVMNQTNTPSSSPNTQVSTYVSDGGFNADESQSLEPRKLSDAEPSSNGPPSENTSSPWLLEINPQLAKQIGIHSHIPLMF